MPATPLRAPVDAAHLWPEGSLFSYTFIDGLGGTDRPEEGTDNNAFTHLSIDRHDPFAAKYAEQVSGGHARINFDFFDDWSPSS